ncbi:nodal homolog 4-A precursor [Xenopus laevis]|uniref:Nodal homolog 4-A n=1 Tax=Xenopus laevis TaxID=8355 RepID=NOD4A_XENLA|nr:nodal homolog 4-A precursor [Xenopus laevis]O13048.1 RecName: Full=Nodal homolog 4-A; AltName: Full=Nodal-related protein 4-A; AltName: Full=Xnr-4; AltName: Full=Xnr4; Flags: Precursor [Xenopus laevis]AAC60127.1 Xnr-4 [Xenopus laevis]
MHLYFYCLILLFVPGGNSLGINSYLKHMSNKPQDHVNRTKTVDSKDLAALPLSSYMLNLYQSFHHSELNHGTEGAPSLPSNHRADIIRSLAAKSFDHGGSRWTLVFDFSSLSQEEEHQLAEVRFDFRAFEGAISAEMEVMVDFLHQSSSCQSISGWCQSYLYVGSLTGTLRSRSSDTWVTFEATDIIHKWFERNEKGKSRYEDREKQLKKLPRAKSAERRYQQQNTEDQQIVMMVYSNISKKERLSGTATLLQDAAHSKYLVVMPGIQTIAHTRRHRRSHIFKEHVMGMKHVPPADSSRTLCRRVDFFVDFKQIGWDSWIIHPMKYNAYRCEGECPSPVNESVKPNNHAYMQSLLNYYVKGKAPEVCCVPIRMSSLSMVYYDHDDIAFQNHEGMIVEECGCQ